MIVRFSSVEGSEPEGPRCEGRQRPAERDPRIEPPHPRVGIVDRVGGYPVAGLPAVVGHDSPTVGLKAGVDQEIAGPSSEAMLSCVTCPEERALQGPS